MVSAVPILSLLLGLSAKFDGMLWTMVVASKACETATVVFPRRLLSLSAVDVGSWAHFSTDATAHTTICFNPKSLVANELSFEKLAYNTAVYAWPSSHIGFFFHSLSLDNLCNDGCQMYLDRKSTRLNSSHW